MMTTQDLRDAKHRQFRLYFGGFTLDEATKILAGVCGNESYLQRRLDTVLVQIEENLDLLDAAAERDTEGLDNECERLARRVYLLKIEERMIPPQLKGERESIEFLEEAFRVETEFRRWGYDSIFAQPMPKKAPRKMGARKRR